MGNWRLKRQIGDGDEIAYKFTPKYVLRAGQTVTVSYIYSMSTMYSSVDAVTIGNLEVWYSLIWCITLGFMDLTLEEQDFSYKNAKQKVNFYITSSIFKTVILGTEKVEEKGILGD